VVFLNTQQLQLIVHIVHKLESRKYNSTNISILFVFFKRDILLKGGSVVDSIIATSICNGAANPHSMGIGGGFFMLIYLKYFIYLE
jgi:hypothetical protein